jgi:hypothetical protein
MATGSLDMLLILTVNELDDNDDIGPVSRPCENF